MLSASRIFYAAVAATIFLGPGHAQAQAQSQAQVQVELLHGADSIFVSPDVAIVWAVLKPPSSESATVWLRIVNTSRRFSHVAIDGVDPFSKKRERLEAGTKIDGEVRVGSDRDSFSDVPSREVHFYRSDTDLRNNMPALTVYYLGVPDTTPEFATRAAMDDYFSAARLSTRKVEFKR